jgi:phenylacetate-CoA ligase
MFHDLRFLKWVKQLLLGPAYFYHMVKIRKSKKWDIHKIETYDSKEIADKRLISKVDIKNNPQNYLNKHPLVPLSMVSTGGTSGKPFIFYQDLFFARQKERAYIYDIWKSIGYNPFDFRIVVRGNTPRNGVRYNYFENALIISQDFFTPTNRDYLHDLFLKKPSFLHVYPSSLMSLIDFFGEKKFKNFPIKGIMAGSEAFPVNQMKWFMNSFNIPIAHWYGHSEYAILARFCWNCEEFHFYPTYGRVNLIQDGDRGDEWMLIATSFNKYGTQFKNYITEDYASISIQPCAKDSYFKVNNIIGRKQEYIIDNLGQIKAFGPYLFGLHGKFWSYFENIQFIQSEQGVLKVFMLRPKNVTNKN